VSYEEASGPGFEDMVRRVPDTGKLGAHRMAPHSRSCVLADLIEDQRTGSPEETAASRSTAELRLRR